MVISLKFIHSSLNFKKNNSLQNYLIVFDHAYELKNTFCRYLDYLRCSYLNNNFYNSLNCFDLNFNSLYKAYMK